MNEKDNLLLGQLIKYKDNDMQMDLEDGYLTEADHHHLDGLIINLVRYYHDIRYCSDKTCGCSPEKGIELHYKEIKRWMRKTNYALYPIPWKRIEEIIESNSSEGKR